MLSRTRERLGCSEKNDISKRYEENKTSQQVYNQDVRFNGKDQLAGTRET